MRMNKTKSKKPTTTKSPTPRTATNMKFSTAVLDLAAACMADRVQENRTEYVSTLIREDWERRGRPVIPAKQ